MKFPFLHRLGREYSAAAYKSNMEPAYQLYVSEGPRYSKLDNFEASGHDTIPRPSKISSIRQYLKTVLLRSVLGIAIFAVLSIFSLPILGYEFRLIRVKSAPDSNGQGKCLTCGIYEPALTVKSPKSNVWAPISPEDNTAVWNFLHDPAQGLNLTIPENAGLNDNQVFWIDTLHMNKSDVVPYLDQGGPKPDSYARVIIFEGSKAEPVSQEYMVGPLPVSSNTKLEKLDYIYNGEMGGALPFNGRGFDAARMLAIDKILAEAMADVADITASLFQGAAFYGASDKRSTISPMFGTPLSINGEQGYINAGFNFPGSATYVLPIDFYVLINWAGTDVNRWKLRGYVTKERYFANANELRAAFQASELKQEFDQWKDYDWALVKYMPELGERPLESRLAPQNIEVGGKRYRVDAEEKYVEYMGWSFYISHTRSLGLMFYDIRFKGERIMYELSMQEAASQYGGYQPRSASTLFHDTSFSLGSSIFPLVEGFDCPFGSTFWNMSFHEGNETIIHPNAICLFEHDSGFPLSRHRAGKEWGGEEPGTWGFENLGVVKSSALSVRFITTVGNYDYIFNYDFHLDGSLEVTVRASGYLMSSFYYKDQGRFGPRIQRATQGSIHDHVITFKADFDILDANNSLQVTELKAVQQSQPWFPELGTFEQLELQTSMMEKEQQFNWAPNGEVMYCVVHANATNEWGEKRGYRIVPGKSNIHLTTLNSPFSRRNSGMLKSHLAVTRQHDTEPYANSVQNVNLPESPQQDFLKFFDGESVDKEDLVVWLNLGMHHFTRAEDVPVTLFTEAVSSVMFAPQNFFDRAQDGDLKNRRWIVPDSKGETLHYDDYGVELSQCEVKFEEPASNVKQIWKAGA